MQQKIYFPVIVIAQQLLIRLFLPYVNQSGMIMYPIFCPDASGLKMFKLQFKKEGNTQELVEEFSWRIQALIEENYAVSSVK